MSYDPFANSSINVDDLEVDILILAKAESSVKVAAEYLTKHGWPTTIMTNVPDAIEHIGKSKPDIIFVSFSHPNPQIQKLPEMITQSFNLICVGFSENL